MTDTNLDTSRPQGGRRDAAVEGFRRAFDAICSHVGTVVEGNHTAIRLSVTAMVAGGHLLIEDVPGVGKTTLAKALAQAIGGTFRRVQFTPDLMPSDVIGSSIWNQSNSTLTFRRGPVFSNVLLADEINRASPKTQSALLEAMAESTVTVEGMAEALPSPFMVIATQNPAEHHGIFPLPESQLDRFTMRLELGYPSEQAEFDLLTHGDAGVRLADLQPILELDRLRKMTTWVDSVHVSPAVRQYLLAVVRATRNTSELALGVSPRASLSLQRCARVWAAAHGRDWVTPDDIAQLAIPVLAHRLVAGSARVGTAGPILSQILAEVPVPLEASK